MHFAAKRPIPPAPCGYLAGRGRKTFLAVFLPRVSGAKTPLFPVPPRREGLGVGDWHFDAIALNFNISIHF
jgi:hypothetical protein